MVEARPSCHYVFLSSRAGVRVPVSSALFSSRNEVEWYGLSVPGGMLLVGVLASLPPMIAKGCQEDVGDGIGVFRRGAGGFQEREDANPCCDCLRVRSRCCTVL